MLRVVAMVKNERKGAMRAIVGRIFYCPLLNSKSLLICIVGKQQKDHKPRSLNYCFFANQRALFFAMPFLHYKGFALTGHLKTAKCECLWSNAHCQVRMFVKQRQTHSWSSYLPGKKYIYPKGKIVKALHHYVLSQWKRFWVCIYAHCSNNRSQMLYTRASFEICEERMFVKQLENTS